MANKGVEEGVRGQQCDGEMECSGHFSSVCQCNLTGVGCAPWKAAKGVL